MQVSLAFAPATRLAAAAAAARRLWNLLVCQQPMALAAIGEVVQHVRWTREDGAALRKACKLKVNKGMGPRGPLIGPVWT